ncbi:hypothetical protein TNIN_197011 [Trichonephila inaurata madagascariensis]|uniref:Uncharacterized protein n=1 Tax=Trichonephila inaurata madagascariensis TaxID=2747483 RepID=A0A8X6YCV3_9ARAC|nr:hypothetical protein TNIN_197011 [Trichonephila inaurata madagascariensis]
MTSIGDSGSSKNEFDCLKCGEGFLDFRGVIFHECPKMETKRRRLLTMFEILKPLQAKKSFEAEQVEKVAENSSACMTCKKFYPSCKLSKVDCSWSLNKQKGMKLPARERYLQIRRQKRYIKPQSYARPKTSPLSDDVLPGYTMERFTTESQKGNHFFNIDPHKGHGHSQEGTQTVFVESLSSGSHPEKSCELQETFKNYFSNDSMYLEAVNVSDNLSSLDITGVKTHLHTEWGKLRYAKSLTYMSSKIPSSSNVFKDDSKSIFF